MDKVYKIASQESGTSAAVKETDWEKCIVCQQITSEVLKCPADSKRSIDGAGYKSLTENLLAFKKIDCLFSNKFPWCGGVPPHKGTTAVNTYFLIIVTYQNI